MRLVLQFLCGVWAATVHLIPSWAAIPDDGQARLHELLIENLQYIQNQGGPYPDAAEARRLTNGMLFWLGHAACPHCPPPAPTTDENATALASTIRSAAEAGKPPAQLQLALRYLEGKGVRREIDQGLRWLTIAAANG